MYSCQRLQVEKGKPLKIRIRIIKNLQLQASFIEILVIKECPPIFVTSVKA